MSRRAALVLLGALTVSAFLLRISGFGESLYGDEMHAYDDVYGRSLAGVLERVAGGEENSPPLYFLLAWGAIEFGDPTALIRLPSLVLGTATVPVVYLLGERTAGRSVGLVAASLTALSPLAVYFSTEARPYATLIFLTALSTLALLAALETRRRAWWLLFWAASAAALYTHNTAVTVLIGQGAWALWAYWEQRRQLIVAYVAVAAAYLPWLPSLVEQREGTQSLATTTGAAFPLSFESFADHTARLVPGYQPTGVGLADVPGRFAMWLFGIAVAVALLGALVQIRQPRGEGRPQRPSRELVLMIVLALAAPAAVLLYSLLGADIYITRHLLASFPATVILLGVLFTRLPRPLAAVTTVIVLTALTIGLVRAFDPERNRPPLKQAARFLDARAGPGDPVVEFVFLAAKGLFTRHLAINFNRHHPLYQTGFVRPRNPGFWNGLEGKPRLFVVEAWGDPPNRNPLPPALQQRFRLVDSQVYRGTVPVAVLEYESNATQTPSADGSVVSP